MMLKAGYTPLAVVAGAALLALASCSSVNRPAESSAFKSPATHGVAPGESVAARKALPKTAVLKSVKRLEPKRAGGENGVQFRFARVVPGYRVSVFPEASGSENGCRVEVRFSLLEPGRGPGAKRRLHLRDRVGTGVLERSNGAADPDGTTWVFWFRGPGPVQVTEQTRPGTLTLSGAR
jgi:hypothetical protein